MEKVRSPHLSEHERLLENSRTDNKMAEMDSKHQHEYSDPSNNETGIDIQCEFGGEEEFCYEEDEFHEDHPLIVARMTASCDSIIGSNNGYHLHNSHPNNQLELNRHRVFATSMPQIASDFSCNRPINTENEFNNRKRDSCDNLVDKKHQISDHIEFQNNKLDPLNQCEIIISDCNDDYKNETEEGCEEGESLDLEFEYEPGISLSHMEFGRQSNQFHHSNQDEQKEDKVVQQNLCRRKMSEMCTSSSCSNSQRDRYHNMMTASTWNTNKVSTSTSNNHRAAASTIGCNINSKSPLVSPTRCTHCGVDYESGQ